MAGLTPPADAPDAPDARHVTLGGYTLAGHATAGPVLLDPTIHWQEGALVAERFRIKGFIGQGGMGKVYLAKDEILSRYIALKCIPQEILFDVDARDDLRQEANRLLDLAHENIVRIHTYYDGPTWPFFAMEYLQGPTLKRLLRARKQAGRSFTAPEVVRIARQVARGLSYAHSKGIIHRDLKPGNLMLAVEPGDEILDRDIVKITDFGISRVIEDGTLRQTGKRSGTLPYMSPEQYRGETCTARSDVYSLACTLYELLSGRPPFHTGDLGYQILEKAPPKLDGVPAHVQAAIVRGLAKDPRHRFPAVEGFVEALEGKARASSTRSRALVALGALAATILLLLSLAPFVSMGRPPLPPGAGSPALASTPRQVPVPPTEGQVRERGDFARRLNEELAKQIPFQIGREFLLPSTSMRDSVAIRFALPEQRSSSYQQGLLERLVLRYYGESPETTVTVEGTMVEGYKTFQVGPLPEGRYSLRAYLLATAGAASTTPSEEILEGPHKFRIDLSPPSLEVVPVRTEVFLEGGPPYRSTFDEAVDLKLVSPHDQGDLAEVMTAIVFGEGVRPWARVEKLPLWRVELPPGCMTTYRLFAKDAAGNRSAAIEVSFRRLYLGVESFGLALPDGVVGNVAAVKGILKVEGDQSPSLRYFVSGELAEPLSLSPTPSAARDADQVPAAGSVDPGAIPFFALLRLPGALNTVEVRYTWRNNPPQPFPIRAVINDVKVKAPRITIDSSIPARTGKPRLTLAGKVEPYFNGLEVSLEQQGQGSRRLDLRPLLTGTAAYFEQEVDLVGGENTLFANSFYNDAPLGSSQLLLSLFHDTTLPGLEGGMSFARMGDYLYITLRPTEGLKRLRILESAGPGFTSDWRVVEEDRASGTYVYVTLFPARPVTFRVEMTDLAGLVGTQERFFTPSESFQTADASEVASGSFVHRSGGSVESDGAAAPASSSPERDPGFAKAADKSAKAASSGLVLISSRFVQDVDMEFVPFGQERYEISRSEVPERAWYWFLKEKGYGDFGPGRTDYAMTLGDFAPDLLVEFAKWFGERADDGYTYDVPTKEQWLSAFAGVNEPERAREAITEWFQGSRKGQRRFEPHPAVRYGISKTTPTGSRRENRTPTDLLDMEANVQEVVLDKDRFKVIGGTNRDPEPDLLERSLEARPYDADRRVLLGRVTGVRLVRRPARAR